MDVKVDAVFSLIKQGMDDMRKYEDELQEERGRSLLAEQPYISLGKSLIPSVLTSYFLFNNSSTIFPNSYQ